MGMSDTLGMIIFMGGQSQPLPTFRVGAVAPVPKPASWSPALAGIGGLWLIARARLKMP